MTNWLKLHICQKMKQLEQLNRAPPGYLARNFYLYLSNHSIPLFLQVQKFLRISKFTHIYSQVLDPTVIQRASR